MEKRYEDLKTTVENSLNTGSTTNPASNKVVSDALTNKLTNTFTQQSVDLTAASATSFTVTASYYSCSTTFTVNKATTLNLSPPSSVPVGTTMRLAINGAAGVTTIQYAPPGANYSILVATLAQSGDFVLLVSNQNVWTIMAYRYAAPATSSVAGAVYASSDQFTTASDGKITLTTPVVQFQDGSTNIKVGYLYYYQYNIYLCQYAKNAAAAADLQGGVYAKQLTGLGGSGAITISSYNTVGVRNATSGTKNAYQGGVSGVVLPNGFQFQVGSTGLLESYPILDMAAVLGTSGTGVTPQIGFLLSDNGKVYVSKVNTVVTRSDCPTTVLENTKMKTLIYPASQIVVPDAIKSAVTGGSFTNGELQGTQPSGSLPDMAFCDTMARYVFSQGMNSSVANGAVYVWIRMMKTL